MKTLLKLVFLMHLGLYNNAVSQAEASSGRTAVSNVTTSQCDAENRCQCVVEAPERCPADVVYTKLVETSQQLDFVYSLLSGEEVADIETIVNKLVVRMTSLESSLNNQSIALSVNELSSILDEALLMQSTLEGFTTAQNSTVIQQLQGEVAAIERALIGIGTYNPLAVQEDLNREISRLRSRLASCATIFSKHGESELHFIGDGLPANHTINREMCPTSRNLSIGRAIVYNYRDNVAGMWLKDPLPINETEKTKIYEMRKSSMSSQNAYYSYPNLETYERIGSETSAIASKCSVSYSYGQKFLYLGGHLYYYNTGYSSYSSIKKVKKFNIFNAQSCYNGVVSSTFTLPNTNADYIGNAYNDADLNFDETGLYLVYADTSGDLMIMRLNPDTLEEEVRWNTGKPKRSVANVFMVCGRLYSVDDYSSRRLTGLQWGYDTNTGEEFNYAVSGTGCEDQVTGSVVDSTIDLKVFYKLKLATSNCGATTNDCYDLLELKMESLFGNVQALSYNPRERAIFGWDNNHPVLYHLFF